jgi:hypothetical protein
VCAHNDKSHAHTIRHTHIIICMYNRRQEPGPRDCGSRPPPVYIIVIIFMYIYITILYVLPLYAYTPVVVRLGSASGQDESRRRNRNLFLGRVHTRAGVRELPLGYYSSRYIHTHTHTHTR